MELKPFGLEGVTQVRGADGRAPEQGEWRAGADAKWEVQPGLVLDATARPDFAQVEADDQVVNLTRFELFFPEKRDFFLENAGIFDFGSRGSYETPPFLLFFSRRIGILGDAELPVLGGLRLSGRAGRQTIGVVDVATDAQDGEPRTNFGVLRYKRDVGDRGYLGAMLTDRRSSSGSESDLGFDTSLWPTPRLNLQGFAVRTSRSDGSADGACTGPRPSTRGIQSTCGASTCRSGRGPRRGWASSPARTCAAGAARPSTPSGPTCWGCAPWPSTSAGST